MLKFMRILFILPFILSICLTYNANAAPQTSAELDDDTLFLAATLWGEARDNSEGMTIVANTIMNRKKAEEYDKNGEKIKTVSIKSIISGDLEQYSSWKGKNWDTSSIIKQMAEYEGSDKESWETCINFAKQALNGGLNDITGGATSYSKKKDTDEIEWRRGETETKVNTETSSANGATKEELAAAQSAGSGNSSAYKTEAPAIEDSSSDANSCNGVEAVSRDLSSKTNSGYGIISDKTMKNMTDMLNRIYKNLGRIFMLGHGILCYAAKVAYSCFGVGVPGVAEACLMKVPNFSFFICGLAIYFTAFLMSIAIGMYFIDICFKLGFAIMYLPVAIALWPFAPTKSKFGEAFGMVLHNSMFYAMMSIGLTYGIVLIYNGVLGDTTNWMSFWNAIEEESSEKLAENFSLTSTRIIVILFCLIFGFKIIASSVNEYLDYFFSDGLMGGQSPMHHLGTQAIGMTAGATLGRLGAYTSDVAKTQTGKGIEKVGDFMVDASQGNFGVVGKMFGSMTKPLSEIQTGLNRLRANDYKDPTANASVSGTTTSSDTSSTKATIGDIVSDINEITKPGDNTISPANIISKTSSAIGEGLSSTAQAIIHPQRTYRTFKQLATEGVSDENSPYKNGKLIITNTGKVIFRKITSEDLRKGLDENNGFAQNAGTFAKNTAVEGAKIGRATIGDTAGFLGRMTQRIGKDMQQNYHSGKSSNWYADMEARREQEQLDQQYEDSINRNDSGEYEEQGQ